MYMNRPFAHALVAGCLISSFALSTAPPLSAQDKPTEKEAELLAVLRSSAPESEKAITCKRLAIHGSSASVGDLAKLLSNERLSSWARIALEAIPGEAADKALRDAADQLSGRQLVGVINSIGVRQDSSAVELLATRLQHDDSEVASAAAVALGKIGTDSALTPLRKALADSPDKVRSAVAEGCVLCAERLLADGKSDAATKLYDEIRLAELPLQRILEATRGAILARGDAGVPLLLEQLRSDEKRLFQLALTTAREFPGGKLDAALAEEVQKAPAARAALIVQAMADRPQTVDLAALLASAGQGPQQVRLAAIQALGRVGNGTCLEDLMKICTSDDEALAAAARSTLAILPGEDVDKQIQDRLGKADSSGIYPVLIELAGLRRIEATSALVKAMRDRKSSVRNAAFFALGETVAPADLTVLIDEVLAPRKAEDTAAARKALKAASIRMPDREATAGQLVAAIKKSDSSATSGNLLEILGAMGGTTALAAVGDAAKSADPQLQDISSRLLGQWMTADAAPVLLDLARSAPAQKYQVRALRGYIRIARQFVLPIEERSKMCRQALEVAKRADEQKLVMQVLQRYPHPQTLTIAVQAMQQEAVKDQATQAALAIAQKLGGKGEKIRALLAQAGFKQVKLEIIKAEYGGGSTQKDVTAIVRKHAADSQLLSLPSSSYNASLGGDPLPGVPKKLRIQYRIDGKKGEATFEENALIVLPVPK